MLWSGTLFLEKIEHLKEEVAIDLGYQGSPRDKGILHLKPIDLEGDVIDVHEVNAEGRGQSGLLRLISLVRGLGYEGQIALDTLQV